MFASFFESTIVKTVRAEVKRAVDRLSDSLRGEVGHIKTTLAQLRSDLDEIDYNEIDIDYDKFDIDYTELEIDYDDLSEQIDLDWLDYDALATSLLQKIARASQGGPQ